MYVCASHACLVLTEVRRKCRVPWNWTKVSPQLLSAVPAVHGPPSAGGPLELLGNLVPTLGSQGPHLRWQMPKSRSGADFSLRHCHLLSDNQRKISGGHCWGLVEVKQNQNWARFRNTAFLEDQKTQLLRNSVGKVTQGMSPLHFISCGLPCLLFVFSIWTLGIQTLILKLTAVLGLTQPDPHFKPWVLLFILSFCFVSLIYF